MSGPLCGASAVDGPCILPRAHNMGKADVPSNHRGRADAPPVEPDGHLARRYGAKFSPADTVPPSPDPVAGLRGQQAKFALHRFAKTTDEADEINRIVDDLLASDKPGLDVERLAEAVRLWYVKVGRNPRTGSYDQPQAAWLAAEYERLSGGGS